MSSSANEDREQRYGFTFLIRIKDCAFLVFLGSYALMGFYHFF